MANEFTRSESVSDYQVYAGREGSMVDYEKEAQKITLGVNAIADKRENRKAEIQSTEDDVVNQLTKADSFENQTLGDTVLLAAKALKESVLKQSKLMKAGLIKPNDFMRFLQSSKDSIANWGIASKDWNEKYKLKESRQKNGPTGKVIASGMETAIAESVLAFNNLNNVVPWVSPSGNTFLVKMIVDPETGEQSMPDWDTQRDNYGSMNNMNNLLLYQSDNSLYDISTLIKNETENLGTFITSSITGYTREEGGGIIVTKEGSDQMGAYIKSEDGEGEYNSLVNKITEVVLGDQLSIANILVDRSGGSTRYIIAQTEQEFVNKGGTDLAKWIRADYTTQPPSVFLEPGQEDAAKAYVEEEILTQLGQSSKITGGKSGVNPASTEVAGEKQDIEDAGYIGELNDVFTNPNSAKSQAIIKRLIDSRNSNVENAEDRIRSIDIESGRIIVRRGGDLDDLVIDRIGDSGVVDDPDTKVDESLVNISTEDDIMSLIEILTPAGKTGISRGRFRDLLKTQKITLGDKLERTLSTSISQTPLNPILITSGIGDGTKTILQTIVKAVGEDVEWDTDNEIRVLLDKVLVQATSKTLKEALVKYNFPETKTAVVKGSIGEDGEFVVGDKNAPSYFEIQIGGETTYIELENAKGNKQTSTNMSRQITEAINTAIKKVNESRQRGTGGAKAGISFFEWRKIEGNEKGTVADYRTALGIK